MTKINEPKNDGQKELLEKIKAGFFADYPEATDDPNMPIALNLYLKGAEKALEIIEETLKVGE